MRNLINALQNEIMHYKTIKMKREEKQKCNVLQWWKDNKNHYPCLFRTALTLLHIPATSVPAERIFSLAGYVIHQRRLKLLATNVNKFIFLHKNKYHILPETSFFF